MVPGSYSRRSVIRTVGTGAGIAAIATAGGSSTVGAVEEGPPVEWVHSYDGQDQEFEHVPRAFRATVDGGYVLGGEGATITETGPEETQFSCLKLDTGGEAEWIAFGLDDHDVELAITRDIVQLGEGGFLLVGEGEYGGDVEQGQAYEPVARVAAFTAEGEVEWTAAFDQFASEENDAIEVAESPRFRGLSGSTDGAGAVAYGRQGMDGWAVAFASDGSIEWRKTYGSELQIADVFSSTDGYQLHAIREDENVILEVDGSGTVENEVVLDIDYDTIPHNHVVIPTTDGGYAITGRYDGRQRMVLETFDETGEAQWLETYNGPYDGYDWAYDIVQTEDEGFALFGQMDAAYTGATVPAIVKTDPAGTEEWQTLLESRERVWYQAGFQTSDGGLAAFNPGSNNFLAKYASWADDESPDNDDEDVIDDDESGNGNEDGETIEETDDGEDDSSDEEVTNESPDGDGEGNDADGEASSDSDDGGTEIDQSDESGSDDGDENSRGSDQEGEGGGKGSETDASAAAPETEEEQPGGDGQDDDTPGFGFTAAVGGVGGAVMYFVFDRDSSSSED